MMRAPYEIGEEIRGRLLKILQTKRNKMGRKSAPMLTSYTEPGQSLFHHFFISVFAKLMASVANKTIQNIFHPVYKNSSLVPFNSRKPKCISIIITKYTSALCSRVVSGVTSNNIITFYL